MSALCPEHGALIQDNLVKAIRDCFPIGLLICL